MNMSLYSLTELFDNLNSNEIESFFEEYEKMIAKTPEIYNSIRIYLTTNDKLTKFLNYLNARKLIKQHKNLFNSFENLSVITQEELLKNFYSFLSIYTKHYIKNYDYYKNQLKELQKKGIDRLIIKKSIEEKNYKSFESCDSKYDRNHIKLYTDGTIKNLQIYQTKTEETKEKGCLFDIESPTYILYKFQIYNRYKPISTVLKTTNVDIDPNILPEKQELSEKKVDFSTEITESLPEHEKEYYDDIIPYPQLDGQKIKVLYKSN